MRTYRRLCVQLTQRDREKIHDLLSGGIQPTRVVLRALALTQLHNGKTVSEVAANVRLASKTVHDIGRRYQDGDLNRALYDKQRPGAVELLDKSQKQRIIAMVCSAPPGGCARWTVRLMAQEAIKRKLVPKVGRETIRVLLLHHDLKPWREKNVVCGGTESGVHRQDGRCSEDVRETLRSQTTRRLPG
jgi:transposase